jgi:hypothetical protein
MEALSLHRGEPLRSNSHLLSSRQLDNQCHPLGARVLASPYLYPSSELELVFVQAAVKAEVVA